MTSESHKSLSGFRAVILAGGRGARLAPYTTVLPKPLMPVGEMPILEILLRQLRQAGVRDFILSVGYLASLLEAYFGDGAKWDVRIQYSREESPLGTAGPLSLVDGLTSTFLVVNGDLLTTLDFAAMAEFHRRQQAVATLGLFTKKVKIDLGVIEKDERAYVTGYIEKPTLEYEVSTGVYVMEPLVLTYIPHGQRLDLPDLVRKLVADGRRVLGYHFEGQWLDIGRPDDYAQAVEVFERDRALWLADEA